MVDTRERLVDQSARGPGQSALGLALKEFELSRVERLASGIRKQTIQAACYVCDVEPDRCRAARGDVRFLVRDIASQRQEFGARLVERMHDGHQDVRVAVNPSEEPRFSVVAHRNPVYRDSRYVIFTASWRF